MEGGLSPESGNIFSWCIQGRLKILDVIVLNSHNTCTNQLASSIIFECMYTSCCTDSS